MSIIDPYITHNRPLSSSTLKTFFTCPRKFFFKMKDIPEVEVGSQLILGKSIHSTCEDYFGEVGDKWPIPKYVNSFVDYYSKECEYFKEKGKKITYSSSSPNKDKEEGGEMLKAFLTEYKDLNIVATECSMFAEIPVNGDTIISYAGIDLVIDEGDGYVLADIKTGKSGASPIYMKEDMQLNQYVYVFTHGKFGDIDHTTKQIVPCEGTFDPLSKPVKAKVIFNIRGFLKQKFTSHKVEYRSDQFNEEGFLKSFKTAIKEMQLYEEIGFWPKRGVGSLHDSKCQWCPYQSECIKEI